jgi:hypothetical protein
MIAIAVGSREIRFTLLPAVALAFWIWPAAGWAYTAEQQQACMGDAFRLCSSEIPDIERVRACMVRQQSDLSPGCRVYFRPVSESATGSIKPAHLRKPRRIRHLQHDDT